MTGKACGSKKPFEGMIPFTIVAALSYIIPAAIVGNFVGAEFVDLIGCVICLIVLVVFAKKMPPTTDPAYMIEASEEEASDVKFGMGAAVLPYILMLVFCLVHPSLFHRSTPSSASFQQLSLYMPVKVPPPSSWHGLAMPEH